MVEPANVDFDPTNLEALLGCEYTPIPPQRCPPNFAVTPAGPLQETKPSERRPPVLFGKTRTAHQVQISDLGGLVSDLSLSRARKDQGAGLDAKTGFEDAGLTP